MLPGRNNVYELDSGRHNIFSDEYDSDVSDGLSKRPYARHARRRLIYALFMTLGLLLVVHYRRNASFVLRPVTTSSGIWEHKEQKSTLDLSHLEQYDLSSSFTYSRRSIEPKRTKGVRPTLTNVSEPLYGSQQVSVVSNGMLSRVSINALPPLPLSIPSDDRSSRFYAPSTTHLDTSTISFGISTDLGRLNDSVPQLAHWLSDSDAHLHVLVPKDDSSGNSTALEKNMNELGMKVTIAPTELTTVRAYFSLIKHLYERRTERTQWVALFDDDTFVPSLPQLVAHLNKNYDATEKKLVGALSDHINQISTWGLIPFGGGGIFISLPLAAQLSADEVYEDCIQSEQEQGDGILNECLQEWSEVRPTYDSLLNQMDLRGDVSGFFESGRKMLTIHHWKTWFNVDIPKVAKVSKACGDEGILMRFNFTNGAVLSNGFSIVDYGKDINNVDFDAIEKTWDGYARDFIHRIGPLREPLPAEEKKSYKMVGTVVLENGDVLQTYIYKAHNDDGSSSNKDDGVIELLWLN